MGATFDKNRVIISKRCLERFKHNSKDLLSRKRKNLARYWNNWLRSAEKTA